MKIEISKVKASPKPIRSAWDEGKMDELKWSLMEEGQVEPIGVHENGVGYVLVWGHRRTEAARRAGWKEIEAVVVPQDEVDNLIQAGIENLASEDMSLDDKVNWAHRLIELGLGQSEISRRSTVSKQTLSEWLVADNEIEVRDILSAGGQNYSQDEGLKKVKYIAQVLGDNLDAKKAVASKVAEDRLTRDQTRSVAEAYRDAPTPEVKAQVLKTPIISRDTAADILRRSTHRVEMDTGIKSLNEMSDWQKEHEERRTFQDFDFAVKEFLDSMRLFQEVARKGSVLVKFGKYSPEAAKFAIRRIDNLIDDLKNYKEALEAVK